ncbi:MAG: hypothetical protein ACU0CC_22420 [Sagittula sp.]|uniref:hypothetical protein n=1 Tax=Sagittula sp. TaxID=2038081 RepID=UPI0040580590
MTFAAPLKAGPVVGRGRSIARMSRGIGPFRSPRAITAAVGLRFAHVVVDADESDVPAGALDSLGAEGLEWLDVTRPYKRSVPPGFGMALCQAARVQDHSQRQKPDTDRMREAFGSFG